MISFHPNKIIHLAEITPYFRNARDHSAAQIGQIAASIREFGFTNPVLVDETNTLIAGHGRLEAAKLLGMTKLAAIVVTGLSPAQQQALRIADNKLALNATWDDDLLRTELMDLRDGGFDLELTGFGDDELAGLFAAGAVGLADPDDVPEPPPEPVTQPGDVWLMGRHRLLCGDATSGVDVALALAGVRPHLMVTDPPYGVNYDPDWRNRADRANGKPDGARAIGLVEAGTTSALTGARLGDYSPATLPTHGTSGWVPWRLIITNALIAAGFRSPDADHLGKEPARYWPRRLSLDARALLGHAVRKGATAALEGGDRKTNDRVEHRQAAQIPKPATARRSPWSA